jgi:hypothetical protein
MGVVAVPDAVYAALAGQGVWKSADHGETWTGAGSGLPAGFSPVAGGLALAKGAPGTLYTTDGARLYRDTGDGAGWRQLAFTGARKLGALAAGGFNPDTLLATTAEPPTQHLTLNGGADWMDSAPSQSPAAASELRLSEADPLLAYAVYPVVAAGFAARLSADATKLEYAILLGGPNGLSPRALAPVGQGKLAVAGHALGQGMMLTNTSWAGDPALPQAFVLTIDEPPAPCQITVRPTHQ